MLVADARTRSLRVEVVLIHLVVWVGVRRFNVLVATAVKHKHVIVAQVFILDEGRAVT